MNNGASRLERASRAGNLQSDGRWVSCFLESVPFRRFSPSLTLLSFCQKPHPRPISPSSIDYVVIGLSFEPCDALLQINLRFTPLLPSPSPTPPKLSIARPELARNSVLCSTNNSALPHTLADAHASNPSLLLKDTRFESQPRSSKGPTAPS